MKTFYIRAASSVVFLVIMVGGILAPVWFPGPPIAGYIFYLLMFFISESSIKEYFKIIAPSHQIRRLDYYPVMYRIPFAFGIVAVYTSLKPEHGFTFTITDAYVLAFIIIAICAFIFFMIELFSKDENSFERIGYKLLPLFWIVIPIQLIILIYFSKGCWFVLSIFSIIWFYDSACYIVGSLIGKHKMIERVSPKKTWEGLIGGVILTLTGAFFINKIPPLQMYAWWQWMILAFVIIISATFGDLIESLFKRGFGIKDSGNMMPGHGGYLDRFDAFFFAVPFASLTIFLLDKLICR